MKFTVNVLILSPKPKNTFFEGIINYSKCNFTYGNLETDISSFDVVLIHWPEHIFNWKEPNEKELSMLENTLKLWQSKVHIIHLIHNEKPHFTNTENYKYLYHLVFSYADTMVHLGKYSKSKYEALYPNKNHIVIPHSLYDKTCGLFNKSIARQKLGIPSYKNIIIVPGRVRTLKEREMITKASKQLKFKNSYVIAPYMYRKRLSFAYNLQRTFLIKDIIQFFCNLEIGMAYRFSYKFVSEEQLSLLTSAADVVLIPRNDSLNSGILFYGLTHKKIVVGPDVGNIKEFLEEFNFPIFSPDKKKSLVRALEQAFSLSSNYNFDNKILSKYTSECIAKKWDYLLESSLKSSS